jgi:hypothetical protein
MEHELTHDDEQWDRRDRKSRERAIDAQYRLVKAARPPEKEDGSDYIDEKEAEGNRHACQHEHNQAANDDCECDLPIHASFFL